MHGIWRCVTLAGGVLWLGLASPALAQANATARRAISLHECLELALQHNLKVQTERYSPEIARYNLSLAYGAYDPSLEIGARRRFVDQPERIDPKKLTPDYPYDQTTDSLGAGLTGLLPSGLSYTLGINGDWIDATSAVLNRHFDETAATAGFTVRQPLLKNLWIDAYRLRISVNKKDLKISEFSLQWQIMNTLANVQSAYCGLIHAREQVRVEEQALDLARQFLQDTRQQIRQGYKLALDEQQAQLQVEQKQTDLTLAQQVRAERQNTLKNLLTDDFKSWIGTELEPTDSLSDAPEPLDLSTSWQSAMARRPDLREARLELEKQDIVMRFNRNQLYPSLDLVGSYGALGVDNTYGANLSDGQPYYSYGAVLSLPLSNRTARNRYKSSQAARKQALVKYKDLEQTVQVAVDNALKRAQSSLRRVQSARLARQFAEAALAAEQKRFANGLSTSFMVLEMQQKLTATRTTEIGVLTDYNQALIQLALQDGTLLDKNQLNYEVK